MEEIRNELFEEVTTTKSGKGLGMLIGSGLTVGVGTLVMLGKKLYDKRKNRDVEVEEVSDEKETK